MVNNLLNIEHTFSQNMNKKLLLFLFSLLACRLMGNTVVYTTDTISDFPNPERGYYYPFSMNFSAVTPTDVTNLTTSIFEQNRHANRTLILREYWFKGFRDRALNDTVLNIIKEDVILFRNSGNKMILRFGYTESEQKVDGKYQDASPEIWKMHLEQLKPILHDAEDVIACVQAGFLGVWGEWYYSSQGTGNNIPRKVKIDLIDQLLDAVPASRSVQLRTPVYKTMYIGHTQPLTADSAFNGSAQARLGHHNDAVFNGSSNMGTYQNRTKDMAYVAQDCLFLPIGGESDLIASQSNAQSVYDKWSTGPICHAEMYQLHYDYLNMGYSGYVLSRWKKEPYGNAGSYFDLIGRCLGYRYAMTQSVFPDSTGNGAKMPYRLFIQNDGYSTVYNARPVKLVFRPEAGGEDVILSLNTDPRFWRSGRQTTVINDSLMLPADMPEGKYHLYLFLPDSAETLKNDPRQAIRFANVGTWDETTGYNDLQTSVVICDDCIGEIPEYVDTALDDIRVLTPVVKKFFKDGQLYISCYNHVYNVQGQCIK